MELSLHIRRLSEADQSDAVDDHLSRFYDDALIDRDRLPTVNRIYVGDEFCPLRLPGIEALDRFSQYAQNNHVGLTLLTPVLTDIWLERRKPLFDALAGWYPSAEVVVNDLGTLLFLKTHHPEFRLAMGRLFNKGFKDPRLATENAPLTQEIEALLSEGTFDHPEFKSILDEFEVSRVERDLMPHARYLPEEDAGHDTAYYFPFGYVTTGRVCWTATFAKNATRDYKPLYQCSKPCVSLAFRLNSESTPAGLLQSGNTIFYRYAPDLLSALLDQARQRKDRLIYQGLAL